MYLDFLQNAIDPPLIIINVYYLNETFQVAG